MDEAERDERGHRQEEGGDEARAWAESRCDQGQRSFIEARGRSSNKVVFHRVAGGGAA